MLIYTPSPCESHVTLPSENKTDIQQKTQTQKKHPQKMS